MKGSQWSVFYNEFKRATPCGFYGSWQNDAGQSVVNTLKK